MPWQVIHVCVHLKNNVRAFLIITRVCVESL